METIGIIIGVIVAVILVAGLITYAVVAYSIWKVKKRAEKFISEKGVETAVKITQKLLDKK